MSGIPKRLRNTYRPVKSFCERCAERVWHSRSGKEPTTARCEGCGNRKYVAIRQDREQDLGQAGTKLYYVWAAMKHRCGNPKNPEYHRYGGRGIKVCRRWLNSFLMFRADMGIPKDGMSIERVDNDGPYSPKNCKWIPRRDQNLNMQRKSRLISFKGTTKSLKDWATFLGIAASTLHDRLIRCPDRAFTSGRMPPGPRARLA